MASVILILARLLIGGIFLISGLAKISDPARFILTLREFRLFPEVIVPLAAIWLPWLEVLLGLCVLLGILQRTSALLLACLNAGFLAAIVSVMARGIVVDCGCFGMLADMLGLPDMADMKAVVRNVVIIGLCLLIFFSTNKGLSLEGYILRREKN
ncbi:MAG: DoxX family membrane protein [Nitrospirae bacterium]|nr:DoxX family membrane protein [Nitrospirota bacterium]